MQVAKEIQLHSGALHPSILALYAAFEDTEGIHLVQELAARGDLYQHLGTLGGHLPERLVGRIVIEPLLQAIVYLHNKVSVVH